MIKFIKLLILLSIFGLAGCISNPPIKTERIVILPPETLMAEVVPETPPLVLEYANKTCSDKEDILIEKFRRQTLKVETCNAQLKSIQKWKDETTKLNDKLKEE